MKKWDMLWALLLLLGLGASQAFAHCEIPCGIYDDPARIQEVKEHILTIEKSMKQVSALSKKSPKNANQIVRWVQNKEHHANRIQQVITQYFMTQRLKLPTSKTHEQYREKLSLLHHMLVYAMKAKQTTDLKHVESLRATWKKYEAAKP